MFVDQQDENGFSVLHAVNQIPIGAPEKTSANGAKTPATP
jgi:hypothetical protein